MSLQIGIVGLPNAGKSTLFNALTRAHAPVANYPFTTIEPNVGVAVVPDQRLHDLAAIVGPEQVTPTTIEFVDIAGLVRGASRGEGLGNQFLSHIRHVDAIVLVARCFEAPDVPHVSPTIDPRQDIEIIGLELTLADLATVERRLEKVRSMAKGGRKEALAELTLVERLHETLSAGRPARMASLAETEAEPFRALNLLTTRPLLYVANVGEGDLPNGGKWAEEVARLAESEGTRSMVLCAQLEMELADWPAEEAAEYRAELGLSETGLNRLIAAGYRLLDLITFFTATGLREVRAWTLRRGSTAWEAAGKVHTDMQRGFIRAEVISHDRLVSAGSFAAARERGLLRLEGRDYPVQDGDVIHFRFAV